LGEGEGKQGGSKAWGKGGWKGMSGNDEKYRDRGSATQNLRLKKNSERREISINGERGRERDHIAAAEDSRKKCHTIKKASVSD